MKIAESPVATETSLTKVSYCCNSMSSDSVVAMYCPMAFSKTLDVAYLKAGCSQQKLMQRISGMSAGALSVSLLSAHMINNSTTQGFAVVPCLFYFSHCLGFSAE